MKRLLRIILDLIQGNLKFELKLKRIRTSKNQEVRINKLSELLVEEFDLLIPKRLSGVKNITIWYDYNSHKLREISTEVNQLNIKFENSTNKVNKNYKN